jgi:hypothetical protein
MFMRFLGIGIGHCNQHTTEAEAEAAQLEHGVGDDSQTCMDDDESDTEGADLDAEDDEDRQDDGDEGTDSDEFDDDDFGYDNL